MKKIISAVTFLLVAFGFTANVNAVVVTSVSTSNERVIVVFKNKADKNVVSKARGNVRREYKNANVLSASIPTTSIKDLKNDPNVLAVEQDIIVKTNSQTVDWGVNRIQAQTSWSSSYTGKGVKIGIVDTGIANHEDLSVAGGAAFTSYTTSYLDDNGHGTHVAGIIGAKNNGYGIVGVANEASLYAIKVLGNDGAGYLSDIIAGIDWCITNKMDIINLSLGSSIPSTALQQEVDKAYNQGILVVAAAGNDGTSDGSTDTVDYPAKYSSVIAVAAIDSNNKRPSFSSTGNTVEVAAPGVNILSTYLNLNYS
ncbi:S8 family peptidase [Clostridium beijerinckii]|uniref:S8 family peptidase n=1 Tax=Clostridium beijerinckii TaxID=1520 RepID=UPI000AEA2205|nr:S8 family peptidase [Clostridium beijerinckii]